MKEGKGREKKKEIGWFLFSRIFVDYHITDKFTQPMPHHWAKYLCGQGHVNPSTT
jgi:hypothetical protein